VKVLRRVVLVAALAVCLFAGYLVVAGMTANVEASEVAIVFGSKVEESGDPSARLKARLDTSAELYASGRVARIFVSGGTGEEGFDESAVMTDFLVEAGVPEAMIVADPKGVTTEATCANAATFMEAEDLETAAVVTQYFHVPRARWSCGREGIEVSGARAPRFFELRDIYSLARETVAFPVYLLRSLVGA
jgi:vancomycin permeability regulator SanA